MWAIMLLELVSIYFFNGMLFVSQTSMMVGDFFFFFYVTATPDIDTILFVGSVRCV